MRKKKVSIPPMEFYIDSDGSQYYMMLYNGDINCGETEVELSDVIISFVTQIRCDRRKNVLIIEKKI